MPRVGIKTNFELKTRNEYTKVDCEVGISVGGRELPSMSVLGGALEHAIEMVQKEITESYKVVPERVSTP